MREHRGNLDVSKDILILTAPKGRIEETGVESGASKSSIIIDAVLNYKALKEHLKQLTTIGLLKLEDGKYITMEKGLHFLEVYHELKKYFPENE